MITTLYPIFELDGEDYVADVTLVLTSSPAQYHAYRLKDRKHRYVATDQFVAKGSMGSSEFFEFMYGPTRTATAIANNTSNTITLSNIDSGLVTVRPNDVNETNIKANNRFPLSIEKRISNLEKAMQRMNSSLETISSKLDAISSKLEKNNEA
jgi:hypothetical protein